MENGISRRSAIASAATLATLGTLVGPATHAQAADDSDFSWDDQADVIVVGCGTGMAAAVTAVKAGAKVIALEKLGRVGGDWVASGGGFWVPASDAMKDKGCVNIETGEEDTMETALAEWAVKSHNIGNLELVEHGFEYAQAFINELYGNGVDFTINITNGQGNCPRCHYMLDEEGNQFPSGYGFTQIMEERLAQSGATVLLNTAATRILFDNDRNVIGIEAADMATGDVRRFAAKAVVIATGSYSSNTMMRALFNPETNGWGLFGGEHGTGDGHRMLFEQGAAIAGFATIKSCPAVEATTSQILVTCHGDSFEFFKQPRSLIVVNSDGKRGYAETDLQLYLTSEQITGTFYEIFDQAQVDEEDFTLVSPWSHQRLLEAIDDGTIAMAQSIEELAGLLYVDAAVLAQTIEEYNEGAETGNDAFGRNPSTMRPLVAPYYVATGTRALGGPSCPTGPKIDSDARVLTPMGLPIKGVYAAGHDLIGYNLEGPEYIFSGTGTSLGYGVSCHAGAQAAQYALA